MTLEELSNKVTLYPDKILSQKCEPVKTVDSTIKSITTSMLKTMKELGGSGLSAPQIGIPHCYFVCNITGKDEDDMVFINPELYDLRGMERGIEGCLSLPNVKVECGRAKSCSIKAMDLDGKEIEMGAKGLLARVWLHEYDHICGILITSRMQGTDKILNKKAINELERFHSQKSLRIKTGD